MAQEIIQINKVTPVGKRRVCAYTRVSSKSEDQENSLTYQIETYFFITINSFIDNWTLKCIHSSTIGDIC